MTAYCLIWILLFYFLLDPAQPQSTPVIGGQCQVGTPNYQIGGKQTQFFLKCEPHSDSPNTGTWVVKSRSAQAAHPPTPAEQKPVLRFHQMDTVQCGQDLNARDGQPCNCPENCLQLDYSSAQCYLQCDSLTRRWARRSCQNGYVFSFEHQACIGTVSSPSNYINAQPSLSQSLTQSLTQSQPQVQIQTQSTQQQTSQSTLNVNNAAGVVCTYHDCSSMKPCSVGTCNNGYCCSLTASNPLSNEANANNSNSSEILADSSTDSNETTTIDPHTILWANDFPIGPPGFGFPAHISTLDQILVKAAGNGVQCAAGFISPIKCNGNGECPPGLFCDSAIESCCPLLLPLTDPNNPTNPASIRIQTSGASRRRSPTNITINDELMYVNETAHTFHSLPLNVYSGCGSSCGNNNYQVISVPSYSCGTSCPRGYSGCCGTQQISCCLRQICPGNLMPTGRSCFTSCPTGQLCISGVCCPQINCPGGYQPNGICYNGYCSPGFQCVRSLNSCCPVIYQTYSCPSGSNSMGSCINGRCGNGYSCNSNSNQCCMDPTVCPDGTQAAGACVNGMCGQGYSCVKGLCCASAAQTPKCLDGSQAVGACINGKCGMGYVCTTGNICCPSTLNMCPVGQVSVGPCVNRMCPAGYTCVGQGMNAQCCGEENNGNNNGINFTPADALGPCINGMCDADAECDTTQDLCFPILGAKIGPCIGGACPPGGYCVASENNCYEWSGAVQAAPPDEGADYDTQFKDYDMKKKI